jgi:hypothetical protein
MLHDLRHLLPLIVIGGGMSFVASLFYGAWLLGRYRGRDEEVPADMMRLEMRLEMIERTLAQTTGALERLEAAHRITARMLTDDAVRAPALPSSNRPITPH